MTAEMMSTPRFNRSRMPTPPIRAKRSRGTHPRPPHKDGECQAVAHQVILQSPPNDSDCVLMESW